MDLSRLKSQLLTSGIQQTNNALFQVISQLIKELESVQGTANNTSTTVTAGIGPLKTPSYLTESDESSLLINSRRLLAGTNVAFDDTVAHERTVNVTVVDREWDVLTDGNVASPAFIFAGGEVIMTHIP